MPDVVAVTVFARYERDCGGTFSHENTFGFGFQCFFFDFAIKVFLIGTLSTAKWQVFGSLSAANRVVHLCINSKNFFSC